jgi:hypothetical protein
LKHGYIDQFGERLKLLSPQPVDGGAKGFIFF